LLASVAKVGGGGVIRSDGVGVEVALALALGSDRNSEVEVLEAGIELDLDPDVGVWLVDRVLEFEEMSWQVELPALVGALWGEKKKKVPVEVFGIAVLVGFHFQFELEVQDNFAEAFYQMGSVVVVRLEKDPLGGQLPDYSSEAVAYPVSHVRYFAGSPEDCSLGVLVSK
jgi:hypothetical protein